MRSASKARQLPGAEFYPIGAVLRTEGISLLEKERRRRQLSAVALAERMGVSRSLVTQVERGWLAPSDTFKRKAAKALGKSVGALFPAFWFLVAGADHGRFLASADGRTLVFSSEKRARTAVADLEGCDGELAICGPAPLTFFAVLYAVGEDEVLQRLAVDGIGPHNERDPAGRPGLVTTTSAGVGGGDDTG